MNIFTRVALLGIYIAPALAWAQFTSPATEGSVLQPVVVTGSAAVRRHGSSPATVDVVGGDEVRSGQLQVNVSESLGRVPGLLIQNRQNYAQDLQVSVRGYGARSTFGVRGCLWTAFRRAHLMIRAKQPTFRWESHSVLKWCGDRLRRCTAVP